jgi:hypothetical protein
MSVSYRSTQVYAQLLLLESLLMLDDLCNEEGKLIGFHLIAAVSVGGTKITQMVSMHLPLLLIFFLVGSEHHLVVAAIVHASQHQQI